MCVYDTILSQALILKNGTFIKSWSLRAINLNVCFLSWKLSYVT